MKTCQSKLKNKEGGGIDHFQLRFRSKKHLKSESISISKEWLKYEGKKIILKIPHKKPMIFYTSSPLTIIGSGGRFNHDCRLVRNNLGKLYISIPFTIDLGPEKKTSQGSLSSSSSCLDDYYYQSSTNNPGEESAEIKVASLDPGMSSRLCSFFLYPLPRHYIYTMML